MLRIQRERLAGLELDLGDYIARYQLNEERLTACAPQRAGDASGADDSGTGDRG